MDRDGAEGQPRLMLSLSLQHDGKPYCNHPCYAALFGPKGRVTVARAVGGRRKRLRAPISWCVHCPAAMLTPLCLSSRVWPGRSREPHIQINLRLVPSLGVSLLPPSGQAGWDCTPQASGEGRQAAASPQAGCDTQPSRQRSGATCWVPAPPLHQPSMTISTRLAPATDAKAFCFVACQQRQGLSRSTVVPGIPLLPDQPHFISHPSLPSLSRSGGSQHSLKTAPTHANRHAFLFLIHCVLD